MKILVVTFPNDLGSRTIEANLVKIVSRFAEVRQFRFAAHDVDGIDRGIDNRRNLVRRFQDAFRLRKATRRAVADGFRILFYNVSPAMFAYGSWNGSQAFITMDWARRLLADKSRPDRDPMTAVHRRVIRASSGVLPMTTAMANCLRADYGVSDTQIFQVPSLFDVEHFDPGEIRLADDLRVLFVGGDLVRKGGDLLHRAFVERLHSKCTLTMVTNSPLPEAKGLRQVAGIRYGTAEHLDLMRSHDLFVLPTREDAGPQVIGEAASAGLAVFTTRLALGAPDVVENGVTGCISSSPEDCIKDLETCLDRPELIRQMRVKSLERMRKEYAPEAIAEAYKRAMS